MYFDVQDTTPILYCRQCGGEIYKNDYVYDLAAVLSKGLHIIHEDCLCDCLDEHKTEVSEYIFADICLLEETITSTLEKAYASDITNDRREDYDYDE